MSGKADTAAIAKVGLASKRGSAPGERRGGRKAGTPNKTTAVLKDAILEAAALAGGKEGLVGYLLKQADEYPKGFLPLLGKVLPLQLAGSGEEGEHVFKIVLEGVRPQ